MNLLKIIIPTGLAIALSWMVIQIIFYNQIWAQPGTTNLPLFLAQVSSVFILLLISFRQARNTFHGGFISFGKLIWQGILTGVAVVFFGMLFFQIYIAYINPEFTSWMNEMYNLSWVQRGLSDAEIQSQQATNDRLASPIGIVYSCLFGIVMTAVFSIIPALLTMRNRKENGSLEVT